jgi:putative ABC transport system ATP-binding protein
MPAVLRLEGVGVTKGGRTILADVALAFAAGGTYSIIGPSGAGKSTLLRLLNRLEEPTTGTLWFHDAPAAAFAPTTLRRRVGMVFQIPVMFAGSMRDNLLAPLRLEHASAPDTELYRRLELVGLETAPLEREASALSVGEKQRLCMARALMTDPEVLLLDEPTAALDPTSTRRLIESLVALNRRTGLTVLMVTHQPDQARSFGGDIVLLVGGRVIEQSVAEQFFASPATAVGRSYLDRTLTGTVS